MKRPMIKGTPVHKASIAKAKAQSIVAQTRTQADSALVGASQSLGQSYVPAAIDYTVSSKQKYSGSDDGIVRGQNKSKVEKNTNKETKKVEVLDPKDYPESTLEGMSKQAVEGTGPETEAGRGYVQPANKNPRVITEQEQKKEKENKFKGKVKELKGYQKEKDAADKEAKRLKDIQMNKKAVIEVGEVTIQGFGDQQIQQYTKEQKERLKKEGVFSEDAEKIVLPEEIVNGEFVSKADGTKLEIVSTEKDQKTDEPKVIEENQNTVTTRTREQKENDKIYNDFRTSKYKKRKMIEGGYTPIEGKSPMEMRDDKIYRNALSDGPIRKNMIKGGYTPK